MLLHHLTTLDHPALEPYRTLREATRHWEKGFFVTEGEKVIRKLLESGFDVISFLMTSSWLEELRPWLSYERFSGVTVYIAEEELLTGIVGFSLHKNVMALVRIPPNPEWEDFAVSGKAFVAVEGIADAENMGMIVRNCAALGADGLIVGGDSCNPYLRRAVRVSVGTVFRLPVYRSDNVVRTLLGAKTRWGWKIIGTIPRGGRPEFPEYRGPQCLLFGSEGEGLSEEALEACDERYTIPMRDGVDSLNVANSLAIVLYEWQRARAGR